MAQDSRGLSGDDTSQIWSDLGSKVGSAWLIIAWETTKEYQSLYAEPGNARPSVNFLCLETLWDRHKTRLQPPDPLSLTTWLRACRRNAMAALIESIHLMLGLLLLLPSAFSSNTVYALILGFS